MWRVSGVLLGLWLTTGVAVAQAPPNDLLAESVPRLQDYLRINTVNPPGNEAAGAAYLARLLEAEGIPYETVEPSPGRANLWARLEGGPEPALILLHHIDTVSVDRRYWTVDPFAAEIRDGKIYGRGALDTKALGMAHLQAFIALYRSGEVLRRPVIFMATADEEAGGAHGVGWLVENKPELFDGVGMVLNEGGIGRSIGGQSVVEIEVTQKVPLWLRVTARDQPGHGSMPRTTSSVGRLVAALERLRAEPFEPRLLPAVASYLRGRGRAGIAPFAAELSAPEAAVNDPEFLRQLQAEDPFLAALTRNTCSITRLEGSDKINVVPAQASAEIDCRLLPDQEVAAFIEELGARFADDGIEIETLMAFSPAVSSTETEAYQGLLEASEHHYPDALVLPTMQTGFTDSHFLRARGIPSYGYAPFMLPAGAESGVHGNDEHIPVDRYEQGVKVMVDLLRRLTL